MAEHDFVGEQMVDWRLGGQTVDYRLLEKQIVFVAQENVYAVQRGGFFLNIVDW